MIIIESKNIGLILSFVGGFADFGIAFLIPFMFLEYAEDPQFYAVVSLIGLILQVMCIVGGIITIIGALIAIASAKIGWVIVLIGAIVGGGNIITIFGAINLKSNDSKSYQTSQNIPIYQPP